MITVIKNFARWVCTWEQPICWPQSPHVCMSRQHILLDSKKHRETAIDGLLCVQSSQQAAHLKLLLPRDVRLRVGAAKRKRTLLKGGRKEDRCLHKSTGSGAAAPCMCGHPVTSNFLFLRVQHSKTKHSLPHENHCLLDAIDRKDAPFSRFQVCAYFDA